MVVGARVRTGTAVALWQKIFVGTRKQATGVRPGTLSSSPAERGPTLILTQQPPRFPTRHWPRTTEAGTTIDTLRLQ